MSIGNKEKNVAITPIEVKQMLIQDRSDQELKLKAIEDCLGAVINNPGLWPNNDNLMEIYKALGLVLLLRKETMDFCNEGVFTIAAGIRMAMDEYHELRKSEEILGADSDMNDEEYAAFTEDMT